MSRIFIFFNLEKKPQFLLGGTLDQACQILTTCGGGLYFRELKDKKLIVITGPNAGEEGPEKLNADDIKHLHIEEEYAT